MLPNFVTIEIPGGNFLLATNKPFIIGKIWLFRSEEEKKEKLSKIERMYVLLETHNIAISYYTSLIEIAWIIEFELYYKVLNDMLQHFAETKMLKSPVFYDKFKK